MEKVVDKSSHKLLIVGLALLLAVGTAGAYLYRHRDQDATKSTTSTPADNPDTVEDESLNTLAGQYEQTKRFLADESKLSASEKARHYSIAAFQAAQLDKAEAKDYAVKALDFQAADPKADKSSAEYKAMIKLLTAISQGDYAAVKPGTSEAD